MQHRYTEEQRKFIKSNVKGRGNTELTEMINAKFGLNLTAAQIKGYKANHKLSSGLDGRFKKGSVPFNKGKKGVGGWEPTQFKKGHKPLNYKPVGSERIDRDGYLLIKVSDHGPWHHRWKHKHKVLWEEANGPVPKGHALIFSDGNKQNINLDNLLLVTRAQLCRLNQNNLIQSDPELTKTGVIIAEIYTKIGERKRKKKEAKA